jgi:2-C-methyl-D-erythritol 4-phosphate cytidylyltransferase
MPGESRLLALVPAAGRGERFGAGHPKVFQEIAGRPVLAWTVDRLLAAGAETVSVALPREWLARGVELSAAAPELWRRVAWTVGGESRQESVAACLAVAGGLPDDLLLIHDGARPAVSRRDLEAAVEAARRRGAAVLGRPVSDTLKRVAAGQVRETVDRSALFRAETPQLFRCADFERALELARRDGFIGTDEASLVERLPGIEIEAVPARDPNPKLTSPADLALLEMLLAGEPAESARAEGSGER